MGIRLDSLWHGFHGADIGSKELDPFSPKKLSRPISWSDAKTQMYVRPLTTCVVPGASTSCTSLREAGWAWEGPRRCVKQRGCYRDQGLITHDYQHSFNRHRYFATRHEFEHLHNSQTTHHKKNAKMCLLRNDMRSVDLRFFSRIFPHVVSIVCRIMFTLMTDS